MRIPFVHKLKRHARENKKRTIYTGIAAVVVLIFAARAFFGSDILDQVTETRAPFVSQLSVQDLKDNQTMIKASGQIESFAQAELRSEVSAKVNYINVQLGDEVYAGQVLVGFSNATLAAQRNQAYAQLQAAQAAKVQYEAGLNAQNAKLQELKTGARPEDLAAAKTNVQNARNQLDESEKNVVSVRAKADADLEKAYTTLLTTAGQSVAKSLDALYVLTDIQYAYFRNNDFESSQVAYAKRDAVKLLVGADDAGEFLNQYISTKHGGARGAVEAAELDPTPEGIRAAARELVVAQNAVMTALNNLPVVSDMDGTHASSLSSAKQVLLSDISTLSAADQNIDIQIAQNETAIKAAEAQVVTSQSAVAVAENQLTITQAGPTAEQLDFQTSQVSQAEASLNSHNAQIAGAYASLQNINAQLAKTVIRSPVAGTVAVLPVRRGELVTPGSLVASVVNTKGLQIKTFVPSGVLSRIHVGDHAKIGEVASGTVRHVAPSIDPATKKVEVLIAINNSEEHNLVVGQFADVIIESTQKDEVLPVVQVPLGAVSVADDGVFVYTIAENNVIKKHPVVAGSVLGNTIEILSGLESVEHIVGNVRGLSDGQTVRVRTN